MFSLFNLKKLCNIYIIHEKSGWRKHRSCLQYEWNTSFPNVQLGRFYRDRVPVRTIKQVVIQKPDVSIWNLFHMSEYFVTRLHHLYRAGKSWCIWIKYVRLQPTKQLALPSLDEGSNLACVLEPFRYLSHWADLRRLSYNMHFSSNVTVAGEPCYSASSPLQAVANAG